MKCANLPSPSPLHQLVNLSEKDYVRKHNKHLVPLANWIKALGQDDRVIPLSVEFEAKIFDMKPEEREEYCKGLGGVKSAMPRVIKTGYAALGLSHFFTAGPDEVRAWTIKLNLPAPQAAGVIHTDFLKNFIAAESALRGEEEGGVGVCKTTPPPLPSCSPLSSTPLQSSHTMTGRRTTRPRRRLRLQASIARAASCTRFKTATSATSRLGASLLV